MSLKRKITDKLGETIRALVYGTYFVLSLPLQESLACRFALISLRLETLITRVVTRIRVYYILTTRLTLRRRAAKAVRGG